MELTCSIGAMYHCIGGTLLAFGLLNFFSGVTAFFPAFSYKPWYIGWSVKIATPIWNGVSYTFAIMCTMFSPIQFTIAIASILIIPYCYYTFARTVGTNYLGYAVELPLQQNNIQILGQFHMCRTIHKLFLKALS
ncbi:transmembrane protein 212-like [Acipenser oxyrinchus oxyrinchus]|uniref:Transmembrane protein 212-like n=1 Tax=Acipenser oxyrinchus oxyrinchus TaxID=40147 RepID=A0AAD8G7F6_ACIOX|nr:transmembrane protein 212-like [Acipenser oxyrinchus oxyrinchus]